MLVWLESQTQDKVCSSSNGDIVIVGKTSILFGNMSGVDGHAQYTAYRHMDTIFALDIAV